MNFIKLSSVFLITIACLHSANNHNLEEGELTDLNVLMSSESDPDKSMLPNVNGSNYLTSYNNELATDQSVKPFNANLQPEYEPVAFIEPGGGVSQKNWNMIKRKGFGQAANAIIKGQSRRNKESQHQRQMRMEAGGKADYNPNLFHWSTWKCGFWDRMPWGTHKPNEGQNSPDCIKSIQVGW